MTDPERADPGAVTVFADGGSRGNPGPAGYGAVVFDADGRVLAERAASVGRATNNVAEYSGLIAGLEAARDVGARRVSVRMDSKLVVEQMSGRWQVKHPDMKPLARQAASLVAGFDDVDFGWVPRSRNAHADRLANEAMDAAAAGRAWVPRVLSEPAAEGASDAADPPDIAPTPQDPAAALPLARDGAPTRFVLVRHGETTWGAQGRFAGRTDVPLTERGRRQALAVAERIRREHPVVVYTSPLQRCAQTAAMIAARASAREVVDDRLLDGLLGEWSGFTAAEIQQRWPSEFVAWRSDPDATPPGGESFTTIRDRVRPLLSDALAANRGRTVVLVTHAAPAKMIMALALRAPSTIAYRLRVDTAALSGFDVASDGAVMVWAVNDTAHLSGDPRG